MKKNNQEEEDMVQLLPHLDEGIITQILLKIPAESLFNTFRYVCKSWLKIISTHTDIHLNRLLPSKPPCLITQNFDTGETKTCFFTLTKEGMVEEQFEDLNPLFRNLFINACCNGLILAMPHQLPIKDVYVVNPLTNYRVRLPLPPIFKRYCLKFVFIPCTGEYKIIVPESPQKNCIQILTLSASDCYGSSSSNDRLLEWRLIEAPHEILDNLDNPSPSTIIAINGMLYWGIVIDNGNGKGMHIVSFDASVEKFHETTYQAYPPCDKRASRKGDMGLIEMGGLLSCWSLRYAKYDSVRSFSVQAVKEFHGGEWIDSIQIGTDFGYPILSFGNGGVLIFNNFKEKTIWALNVKLNQWWKVQENSLLCFASFYGFHVNNKHVPLESIFAIESGASKEKKKKKKTLGDEDEEEEEDEDEDEDEV